MTSPRSFIPAIALGAALAAPFLAASARAGGDGTLTDVFFMGAYTNNFSAPMPSWWGGTNGALADIVFSNDYAVATEDDVIRFAMRAYDHISCTFSDYNGYEYYRLTGALAPYYSWWGGGQASSLRFLLDLSWPVWEFTDSFGISSPAPFEGAGTYYVDLDEEARIGHVKNAFAVWMDDEDCDGLPDDYELDSFGSLSAASGPFDDPGGDGLRLVAEIKSGLDPTRAAPPFSADADGNRSAVLFPEFSGSWAHDGSVVFERTIAINRIGTWQHFFLSRHSPNSFPFRVDIQYSDSTGTFHAIGLEDWSASTAVRLSAISPGQSNLTIRAVLGENANMSGEFYCPSITLSEWQPALVFEGGGSLVITNGVSYYVVVGDGLTRPSVDFTVAFPPPPDGSSATNWPDAPPALTPFSAGGLVFTVETNSAHTVFSGSLTAERPGLYPLDGILPSIPAPAAARLATPGRSGLRSGASGGSFLALLDPRLTWPSRRKAPCYDRLSFDSWNGVYCTTNAYPLDSECLWREWHWGHFECEHDDRPTLTLGDEELEDLFSAAWDVDNRGDGTYDAACAVFLGATNVWNGTIDHVCWQDSSYACHYSELIKDEDGDCSCDCEGGDAEGSSMGSCQFRLPLGFPREGQVSAFLWLRTEQPVAVSPAAFQLLVRDGAAVSAVSNNAGGTLSRVVCSDARGRDVAIAPIANGVRITVLGAADGALKHIWEITNPGGNAAAIRLHKISRLGNTLSDHTYARATVYVPPADIRPEDFAATRWTRTDNVSGLVETRIVSGGLGDEEGAALYEENVRSDASGAILSRSVSRRSRIGEGRGAVMRTTMRQDWVGGDGRYDSDWFNTYARFWEDCEDDGRWRESYATYWEDPENRFAYGLPRLVWGDRPWSYRAYDALGRETLALSPLDGVGCPSSRLDSAKPTDLSGAVAAMNGASFKATVTDYSPLPGDGGDMYDAPVPRRVDEYECPSGAPSLVARTWTVIARGDFGGAPVVETRTIRAASGTVTFDDPSNAVSVRVSYDYDRTGTPFALRGRPIYSQEEDGTRVTNLYSFGTLSLEGGDPVFSPDTAGPHLMAVSRRLPALLPSGVAVADANTARPDEISVYDSAFGNEILSGSRIEAGGAEWLFDWRLSAYDDQNRLRSSVFSDGSDETNSYSCCRLLWSRPRDGYETHRLATTGTDRLYYATEERHPLAAASGGFRVTRHFFDAMGRETNTVTGVSAVAGAAVDPLSPLLPGSATSRTVSYPFGTSDFSLRTDARGVETGSFSDRLHDGTYSTSRVTPPDGDWQATMNTSVRLFGGDTYSRRDTYETSMERMSERLRDSEGRLVETSRRHASDLQDDIVASVAFHDFLGRAALTLSPATGGGWIASTSAVDCATGRVLWSRTGAQPEVVPLLDSLGDPVGTLSDGVANFSHVGYSVADGVLWRVTRSFEAEVAGGVTNCLSTVMERLSGLGSDAVSAAAELFPGAELRSQTVSLDAHGVRSVSETAWVPASTALVTVAYGDFAPTSAVVSVGGWTVATMSAFGETRRSHDALGRQVSEDRLDPGAVAWTAVSRTTYNADGTVASSTSMTPAGLATTSFEYDGSGRVTTTTHPGMEESERYYDAQGRVFSIYGDAEYPVEYAHDCDGNRTAMTMHSSSGLDDIPAETSWEYDRRAGLQTAKTYDDGSVVRFAYDAGNRPTRTTWARGAWRETTYNADGSVSGVTYSDATPPASFAYDAWHRLALASNAVARVAYARDDLGTATNEAVAVAGGPAANISRTLDAAGRLATVAVSSADIARTSDAAYSYDAFGRLAVVSNAAFSVAYSYAPDGREAGYAVTTTGGVSIVRSVLRDALDPSKIAVVSNAVGSACVSRLAYAYDNRGRVVTRGGDSFSYNSRSELVDSYFTGGHGAYYGWDDSGNLEHFDRDAALHPCQVNNLNQILWTYDHIPLSGALVGEATWCSYDLDGNMTGYSYCPEIMDEFSPEPDSFDLSLSYDAENRPVTVRSNGVLVAAYAYDHLGRRVRKVTPSATHIYHYDGWNLVREVQWPVASGQSPVGPLATSHYPLVTDYFWGKDLSGSLSGAGGVGGLLAVAVTDCVATNSPFSIFHSQFYFPTYDANGNITAYVSETGEVVAQYAYDGFGRTLSATGPLAATFRHRFSTKYLDDETGFYYYGHRYYAPELTRWTTRDPIEEDGGLNLYSFCGNNGICYTDPRGENPLAIALGLVLLIASNPDTANAPGIGDSMAPSMGMPGMFFDITAGRVVTLVLKGCGIVLGKIQFKLWQVNAEYARDILAQKYIGKSVAIGAFDARTGAIVAATSGKYIPEPTPVLNALSDKLGGVGAKPFCENTLGCCAEFHAADMLIKGGAVISDIRFTKAIRPRIPNKVIPACDNCLKMFEYNFNSGAIPVEAPNILLVPTGPLLDISHEKR